MLELVLEHLADRAAERPVGVAAPDGEVLAHAVDLDGFEDEMDGRRAEEPAGADDDRELQPAPGVESRKLEAEEALPERDVTRLDRDELVERPDEVAARDVAERGVEREIEQLVEDEPPGELRVRGHIAHRAQLGT